MQHNPYVGPKPYSRQDRDNFYGREQEAHALLNKIMANRLVLFYAQSGAGKSSLLNAQVIPALEERGFAVLPTTRVGNDLPPGLAAQQVNNIFVFSTLLGLADPDTPAETLVEDTLLSFLQRCHPDIGQPEAALPILIWDQFEELFTTHQERWAEIPAFFEQVRTTLDALPTLGVLFVMREDHLAAMDKYAYVLQRPLRARFRLERLGYAGALAAVQQPARRAGRPFAAGVAEKLVDDLRRIREQKTSRAEGEAVVLGPYVEPVHLQVVCSRLWDNLPEPDDDATEAATIQWEAVEQFGDIDRALTGFYESALARGVEAGVVSERQLRRWFGEHLITPMQTRGLVLRGHDDTEGLSNAVVDSLENQHIIRAEARAGARWYELSHDRLVAPVLQSNRAWELRRMTPFRQTAKQWAETGDSTLLYQGAAVNDPALWLQAQSDNAEPYELEFLEAGRQAEQARQRKRRFARIGAAVGTVIVIVMTLLALTAIRQARLANARSLAIQADEKLKQYNIDLALLLAIEAVRAKNIPESTKALHEVLAASRLTQVQLAGHTGNIQHSFWDATEQRILTASNDKTARLWDAQTGAELLVMKHKGVVLSAQWNADSRYILTASKNGTAQIWDVETGAVSVTFEGHAKAVDTAVWNADESRVLTAGRDSTAQVWDAATGKTLLILSGHTKPLLSCPSWSPDESRILTCGEDATARVWDAQTAENLLTLPHREWVSSASWSADGRHILTSSGDASARVWDAETGQPWLTLEGHASQIRKAVWNHAESRILTVSDDYTARVWDAQTGATIFILKGHAGAVWDGAWSPGDNLILTASLDGTARVWDAATGELYAVLAGHASEILEARWDKTGRRVLTSSTDDTALVWNLDLYQAGQPRDVLPLFVGHAAGCTRALWNADESRVLTASDDGTARVWDAQTGAERFVLAPEAGPVKDVMWNRNATLILTAHANGAAYVWDAQSGAIRLTLVGHTDDVWQARWNAAETYILTAGADNTARIWDAQTGAVRHTLQGHTQAVAQATWSPDESRVLTISDDNTARVWDAQTETELHTLEHQGIVLRAIWSADGSHILTTSADNYAYRWDAETGAMLTRYPNQEGGHEGWVYDVAWNSKGNRFLTAGGDRVVAIWSTRNANWPLRLLEGHTGAVYRAIWNEDSTHILTVSEDGTARMWDGRTPFWNVLPQHVRVSNVLAVHDGPVWDVQWSADQSRVLTAGEDGIARQSYTSVDDLLKAACEQALRNMSKAEWRSAMPGQGYRKTCADLPAGK